MMSQAELFAYQIKLNILMRKLKNSTKTLHCHFKLSKKRFIDKIRSIYNLKIKFFIHVFLAFNFANCNAEQILNVT